MSYLELNIGKRIINKIKGGKQVFTTNEIKKIDVQAGTLVKLLHNNKFVAWATINPKSRNYIRILSTDEDYDPKEDFVEKLKRAKKFREKIKYKNHYRWVYSESDFLSGLIIDKYNEIAVIQNVNPFYEKHMNDLVEAILEVDKTIECVYRKDSYRNSLKEGLHPKEEILYGNKTKTIIKECKRKFLIDVEIGQKTGWFLDQRENRKIARKVIYGRVLDVFAYTGSFGIISNANEVVFVEKDKDAIKILKKNLELNNVYNCKIIKDNAFSALAKLIYNKEKFDTIVLDPPSFTSMMDVKNAIKSYAKINSMAVKLIDEGFFITCSCSQQLSLRKFYEIVKTVIRRERKRFEIVYIGRQALDHKIIFPHKELEYLKCLVLEIF